jgi:hypothetical protein
MYRFVEEFFAGIVWAQEWERWQKEENALSV